MSKSQSQIHSHSAGFTIIELLIATVVFSLILIILTYGVVQISSQYNKGIISNETQNTARNVADTVSQALQFDGGPVVLSHLATLPTPATTYWFCIADQVFAFQLGQQLVTSTPVPGLHQTTNDVFVHLSQQPACPTSAPLLSTYTFSTGTELLSPRMRLSELSIQSLTDGVYRVTVQVTYGDSDLLNHPTYTDGSTSCLGQAGDDFCAVSKLTTVVEQRVGTD